ncbi:MAG: hypothetical protein JNK85_15955 [Verrucomicrobiales bacterium]|nr:hypothetical protein [Verrucomicrobiales bacterium]
MIPSLLHSCLAMALVSVVWGSANANGQVYVTRRTTADLPFAPDVFRYDLGGQLVATGPNCCSSTWYEGVTVADQRVFVADWTMGIGRIFQFDLELQTVAELVGFDRQLGYTLPTGLATGPDGSLFAAGMAYPSPSPRGQIFRFDADTGQSIGSEPFVALGAGGLRVPFDLEFGPDGNLYVSDRGFDSSLFTEDPGPGRVLRFDGQTGAFIDEFIRFVDRSPTGLAFLPTGVLLVASGNQVLRFDPDGSFLGNLVDDPSPVALDLRDIELGPGGDLLAASPGFHTVLRYRATDGSRVGEFTRGGRAEFGFSSPQYLWAQSTSIPEPADGGRIVGTTLALLVIGTCSVVGRRSRGRTVATVLS